MTPKTPRIRGFHGIIKAAPKSACNTRRGLTHSTGTIREGLPDMVPKTCSIDGCGKEFRARGLCVAHYNSARLAAQFETTPRTPTRTACAFEGCGKKHLAGGFCAGHRMQFKSGKPLRDLRETGLSVEDRFRTYVDTSGDCHEWIGARLEKGYGNFNLPTGAISAHRFAFEMANGQIPKGLEVDHICLNRACVNPSHLRLATRKQNMENRAGVLPSSQTGIRGVTYRRDRGKWIAYVGHNHKLIYLGAFNSPEEAEAAAIAGRLARFTHNELDRRTA